MADRPEWFAPKRYGIGAGLPIAWQGWVLLAGFLLVICLAFWLFGPANPAGLAVIIPAGIAFAVITAMTTKGGWRWRWGEDE